MEGLFSQKEECVSRKQFFFFDECEDNTMLSLYDFSHTGNADDENGIDDIEKGGCWIGLKQGNGAKEKEEKGRNYFNTIFT